MKLCELVEMRIGVIRESLTYSHSTIFLLVLLFCRLPSACDVSARLYSEGKDTVRVQLVQCHPAPYASYQGVLIVYFCCRYLQEITELMESLEEELSPDITVLVCTVFLFCFVLFLWQTLRW